MTAVLSQKKYWTYSEEPLYAQVLIHPCYSPASNADHDDLAMMHLASDAGVRAATVNGMVSTLDVLAEAGRSVFLSGTAQYFC